MKTNKYAVIGSQGQVAAVDFKFSLNHAKRVCRAAQFGNGLAALVAADRTFSRKADAELFLNRCNSMLAFLSGRLGRWITPTFVLVRLEEARVSKENAR